MKASHQQIQHPHQLERGWVIANHILVSFHVAFISSVLCIPFDAADKGDVLRFIFRSPETIVSVLFWYLTWHVGIAVHEMGHYLKAVDLDSLKRSLLPEAQRMKRASFAKKLAWYAGMFIRIPWGRFSGVRKQGLTYYPDAPYNLAVAAAGPKISRNLAWVTLPPAVILLAWGLAASQQAPIYAGRLLLGMGAVGLLDFLLADPGQYKTFKRRERAARARRQVVQATAAKETHRWIDTVADVKRRMIETRMQEATLPDGTPLKAPWGFRNSGMGGRHTEKEFPESNISMQETMFIPLSAHNYEDAQRMTVELQTRFKEIIENAEGARVLGVGLEGGLAAYVIKQPEDIVPEQRLWRMAHQAIMDCGYRPGTDVVLAFDPAASELENAYRDKFEQPDQVGMYLFWRDEAHVVMNRDELFELYRKTLEEDGIPIVSIEDGFAEDDDGGWRLLMDRLSDKIFIIGDDSVTTRDSSIEFAADAGLNNCALIKANQIGTLSECLIAMLVALGKGSELVVSHRSKSPNDDMEAQIALAANAVGLKAGGGANTERLVKYGSVMKTMKDAIRRQAVPAGLAGRADAGDAAGSGIRGPALHHRRRGVRRSDQRRDPVGRRRGLGRDRRRPHLRETSPFHGSDSAWDFRRHGRSDPPGGQHHPARPRRRAARRLFRGSSPTGATASRNRPRSLSRGTTIPSSPPFGSGPNGTAVKGASRPSKTSRRSSLRRFSAEG